MIRAAEVLRFSLVSGLLCFGLPGCADQDVDLDGPPVQLPTMSSGVETLALRDGSIHFQVDDSRLFWETASAVQSCVYSNCAASLVRYQTASFRWFELADTDVFFASGDDYAAKSCPKSGCTTRPAIFSDDAGPLAFDSNFAYWSGAFKIYRCPLANCGDIPQVVADEAADPGEYWTSLHIEGSTVIWLEPGVLDPVDNTTRYPVREAPIDGSQAPITLASVSGSFTTDSTSVYGVDDMSRVERCPLAGCNGQAPAVLVSTTTPKRSLAVDATGIYWLEPENPLLINEATDSVRYCPLAGCGSAEPQRLTPSPVLQFALDSTHVYWSDADNTALIHRMPKPAP